MDDILGRTLNPGVILTMILTGIAYGHFLWALELRPVARLYAAAVIPGAIFVLTILTIRSLQGVHVAGLRHALHRLADLRAQRLRRRAGGAQVEGTPMTTHRHKDSLKKWTTSVTDPNLAPYATDADVAALAARVTKLEADMANVILTISQIPTTPVTPPVPPVTPPPVTPPVDPPVDPVTPPVPPVTGAIYGVGIGMDTLANTTLGGSGPIKSFMRFRAPVLVRPPGFRVYFLSASSPSGYGGGTGGTKRFTIQADDGTADHFPASTVLATQNVAADPTSTANYYVAFTTPPRLTAGTLYHLVCENTDASPGTNYFALDYAWTITPRHAVASALPEHRLGARLLGRQRLDHPDRLRAHPRSRLHGRELRHGLHRGVARLLRHHQRHGQGARAVHRHGRHPDDHLGRRAPRPRLWQRGSRPDAPQLGRHGHRHGQHRGR